MVHDPSIRKTQLRCQLRVNLIQMSCSLCERSIVVESQCGNDTLEHGQALQI
jgi:hypothetical protein